MTFPNMNIYYRNRYANISFRYNIMYSRKRYAYKQFGQDRNQDLQPIKKRYIMKTL